MLLSILILLVRRDSLKIQHVKAAFTEPFSLIGEGEYNLNVLKEIKATDSYLGLDQDVKKCQNDEPLFNCTTRKFIKAILEECKCLPSSLGLTDKVKQI